MSIQSDLEKQHTKRLDKRLGGKTMRGSGVTPGYKGDREYPPFLFEQKTSNKASMSLKKAWLEKIDSEAYGRGLIPGMILSFENMAPRVEKDWVLIDLETFKEMAEQWKK